MAFSRGRPARNRVVFIISGRIRARKGEPPAKQTPLTWPYSSHSLRPSAARGGETPSEGFPLMKTTRFPAGPPLEKWRHSLEGQGSGSQAFATRATRPCPLPWEEFVEGEIERPPRKYMRPSIGSAALKWRAREATNSQQNERNAERRAQLLFSAMNVPLPGGASSSPPQSGLPMKSLAMGCFSALWSIFPHRR